MVPLRVDEGRWGADNLLRVRSQVRSIEEGRGEPHVGEPWRAVRVVAEPFGLAPPSLARNRVEIAIWAHETGRIEG